MSRGKSATSNLNKQGDSIHCCPPHMPIPQIAAVKTIYPWDGLGAAQMGMQFLMLQIKTARSVG